MIFGIAGSHRSGKTTLAKAVAEDLGIKFVSQSFGEAARRHGVDPVSPMTLLDRVRIQQTVLDEHIDLVRDTTEMIIVDRTPVDMLAYLLAEFHMQSHLAVPEPILDLVHQYKWLAIQSTGTYYDNLFVVQPLDTYAAEEGKPAINRAYQDHIQLLIDGACMSLESEVSLNWINTGDFEERRAAMSGVIVKRLDELDAMRKSSAHIH